MPLFNILPLLPERPAIKIVDVGAMTLGTGQDPYQKLLEAGVATVVGFEPNQAECAKLVAMSLPGRIYLPFAIGNGLPGTLNICNFSPTSSLFEPDPAVVNNFQNLGNIMQVIERHNVTTKRLDDIPEAQGADYIKLDVQGGEIDVLNGSKELLKQAVVVHTEVNFIPLYKNQPLFAEVDINLRDSKFAFHMFPERICGRAFKPIIANGNINNPVKQMLWADAVYVRRFQEFDHLTGPQLIKIATILHVQYESVDLALLALARYDAKNRSDISFRYLERLVNGRIPPDARALLTNMTRVDYQPQP